MNMRGWISICVIAAACEAPVAVDGPDDSFLGDGKADTGGVAEGSAEARGVLAVVNGADYAKLHDRVGLEKRAAMNIVVYREGDDQVAGTEDDQQFDTLKELDDVPYMGPAAFAAVLKYARDNGYVNGGSSGGSSNSGSSNPSSGSTSTSLPETRWCYWQKSSGVQPVATRSTRVNWLSGWPSGPFNMRANIGFQSSENFHCYPSCIDRSTDILIARGADGALTARDSSFLSSPTPIDADGHFVLYNTQVVHKGTPYEMTETYWMTCHLETSRLETNGVVVIDSLRWYVIGANYQPHVITNLCPGVGVAR